MSSLTKGKLRSNQATIKVERATNTRAAGRTERGVRITTPERQLVHWRMRRQSEYLHPDAVLQQG